MKRAREVAGAAVLYVGCAAALRPSATAPPATGASPTATSRGADTRDPMWFFYAYSRAQWGEIAEVAPDGTRRMFYVSGRFEARGDVFEAAEDLCPDGLHTAVNLGGGWRFFSPHGAWEAPSFLGPLRRVGWFSEAWVGIGTGPLVAVSEGRLEGVEVAPGYAFIDAAFANDRQGVAVVEPGELIATEDGGARWRRVPTGDELPTHVDAIHARRWHALSGMVYRLDGARRDGRGERFRAPARPTDEDIERIEEHPNRTLYGTEALALVGTDRRHALVASNLDALLDLDLATGELTPAPAAPCAPDEWISAGSGLVVCRGEDGRVTVYARGETRWDERLTMHACGPVRCAASADGEVVGCTGRCDEDAPCPAAMVVCERRGASPTREVTVGDTSARWNFLGYDGHERVLVEARDDLWRARARRGDAPPVALAAQMTVRHPWLVSSLPRIGNDGAWRVTVREEGTGARVDLEGVPGGAWHVREAPPWIRERGGEVPRELDAARACGEDGVRMAVAPDGVPWVSASRDARWRPVIDEGDAPGLVAWFRRVTSPAHAVMCNAAGWKYSGDTGVWGAGWGRARLSDTWTQPPLDREDEPTWTCARGAEAVGLRVEPQVMENEGEVFVANGAAFAHGTRIELGSWEWSSAAEPDARTADYDARVPEALARWLRGEGAQGVGAGALQWGIFELHDTRALVHVWGELSQRNSGAAVVELSAHAPPRVLYRYRSFGARDDAWNLVARDGDTLGLLAFGTSDGADALPYGYVAATLMQRVGGRYSTRAALTPASGAALRGAYALGSEAGVARMLDDGTLLAMPFAGGSRVLGRGLRVGACGPSARGDFAFDVRVDVDAMPDPVDLTAILHASLDGGALCVRSITSTRFVVSPPAGQGASLDGSMEDGGVWNALRCDFRDVTGAQRVR